MVECARQPCTNEACYVACYAERDAKMLGFQGDMTSAQVDVAGLKSTIRGKELQIKDLQRELAATQEELSNLTLDLEDAQSKIAGFGTTKAQGECIKSAKNWNSLEWLKMLQFAACERLNFVLGCPTSHLQPPPLPPPLPMSPANWIFSALLCDLMLQISRAA
jgi:hypothetical protein